MTAGATFATTSAYDATGMRAGLPVVEVVLVPLVVPGSVVDANLKLPPLRRLHAPSTKAIDAKLTSPTHTFSDTDFATANRIISPHFRLRGAYMLRDVRVYEIT